LEKFLKKVLARPEFGGYKARLGTTEGATAQTAGTQKDGSLP
jgi:hypothetical protein